MLPGAGLTIDAGEVVCVEDPAATPVPLRVTVPLPPVGCIAGVLQAPVTAPADVGAKARSMLTTLPGATVIGSDASPVIENGCPLTVMAETCTDAVPLLVSVTDDVPVLPDGHIPKGN